MPGQTDQLSQSNIHQIWKIVVRTSKEDSAFFYFTLEANENICFYSTLDATLGQPHRDIAIGIPRSLRPEFDLMFTALCESMKVQILSEELSENVPWTIEVCKRSVAP
ncbi:MAG: hypothetical protein A2X86_07855 [Bdellovibrionales bacterium GWA2_49_15]|nr:MAG: hypothetical protein A2X86_07855 [Bdellovibrionales bacterium GWA2_49_15]HAZ11807.1 hypothetical protein [Bdellovibrionales bacterium]